MLNSRKIKFGALKLSQLRLSDQRWVLQQLPPSIAERFKIELTSLTQIGLVNPKGMLEQLQLEEISCKLSVGSELVIKSQRTVSKTDLYIYYSGLDNNEREQFKKQLDANLFKELKAFKNELKAPISTKFAQLFAKKLIAVLAES